MGLVFGVAIAFFLEYLDTSVKSLEDVERFLKVPVLAVIPKDVGVLHKQSGMSPDAEAYVEVGQLVEEDSVVCILEAMKLMNEIQAEEGGVVREVCAEDAEPVEYGTVLFYYEPAG